MTITSTQKPDSISIIVPCYNAAPYLRETLESALKQTMPPVEVIVVDDGSTDDSVAIARSFGASVRVVCQKNGGVSVARNNGIQHAKGDYLIFLDADDLLDRDALAVMSHRLERAPGSAVVMSFVSFDRTPQNACSAWSATSVAAFFPHLLTDCIGFPGAWLFPRKAVLEAGSFDADVRLYQFWHFLCKIALLGTPLESVESIGAYYRQLPTSMVHSASKLALARGHVHVQTVLCRGILKSRPDLLEAHGDLMFWAAWTALHRARAFGVPEAETEELAAALGEIAQRGPKSVRRTLFARTIRLVGVTGAERIRSAVYRNA